MECKWSLLRKGQADTFHWSQLVCLLLFRKRFKKPEEEILLVNEKQQEKKNVKMKKGKGIRKRMNKEMPKDGKKGKWDQMRLNHEMKFREKSKSYKM